jgi:hypothetical protein
VVGDYLAGRGFFDDSDLFEPHDVFVAALDALLPRDRQRLLLFSYFDRVAQEALGFWRE